MTHCVDITQITADKRQSPYGQQWSASMWDTHRGHYKTKTNQRSPEAAIRALAEMVRGESIWGTFVASENECEPYKTEPRSDIEKRLYEIQKQEMATTAYKQQAEEWFTLCLFGGITLLLSIYAIISIF